jgi:sirohydrochlorin cobaltochelatase
MKKLKISIFVFLLNLFICSFLFAQPAVILASFGTTVPEAVQSIENIAARVRAAFPGVPVKVAFTSNIIRSVWEKRSRSPEKWRSLGVPDEILFTKNLLSTFGELKSLGFKEVIVQPTHLFHMEQYHDLQQYVDAIRSIRTIRDKWKPFNKIALGRPALGTVGNVHPYHLDLEKAVKTLAPDITLAREKNAALVYMGHGNDFWSTGIYSELQDQMRKTVPDVKTIVGCVEGFPGITEVKAKIEHDKAINKIMLKPLMIVAGDHAFNDMAGEEQDSWKNILKGSGMNVEIILKGLGSNNQFADLFVDHIKDAAEDAGIDL